MSDGVKNYVWMTSPDDWEKLSCDSVYDVENMVNNEFFYKNRYDGLKRAVAWGDGYKFEIENASESVIFEFREFLYNHKISSPRISRN
jgi:hypothetical protein